MLNLSVMLRFTLFNVSFNMLNFVVKFTFKFVISDSTRDILFVMFKFTLLNRESIKFTRVSILKITDGVKDCGVPIVNAGITRFGVGIKT